MIADVGSMDKLQTYGISNKRIPQWMMPNKTPPTRLDIVMVHTRAVDINPTRPLPRGTRVSAIEIGYRSDYDPDLRKFSEKTEQHQTTCELLRRRYDLDYQVWDIGHTGMIPNRLRAQATRLGVANVDKLLRDIHRIAVEHALLLVHERRAKEKEAFAKNAHGPSAPLRTKLLPKTHVTRGVG
jgi:hypothetical protein